MFGLRYAAILAVAIWVGGLVALGAIAAPAIFHAIEARPLADPRGIAGAAVGEALRRFHLVTYACGATILLTLAARGVLGPRPRRLGLRAGIAVIMLATTLYSGLVVSTRIERAREEIGVAPSTLPQTDPRRIEFGRLHGQSTALQMIPLIGGLLLMFWELRD